MLRHTPDMFADSSCGDLRLIRTAGRRWFILLRCAGNEWKRQSKAASLKVALPVAEKALAYVYSRA